MRPEWFREGNLARHKPDPRNLSATHIHLRDIELPDDAGLERVFHEQQGEVWSPSGEARDLIRSKGLQHTSMSVGDVVVADGEVHVVASFEFESLGRAA
jgi:hypothetical protein